MALSSDDATLADQLVTRFFRYLAVTSQSDPRASTVPSTPGQWDMARLLQAELTTIGLSDIHLDEHAVLTARLPGTVTGGPRIGFCAHVDTVDVGLSPHIHPSRMVFTGEDLCLNPARDIWLRAAEHPELHPYTGQEVIFGDGTSVLGSDNKAAVTILMALLDVLARDKPPHGDIFVAFVPDEEIGLRGAKVMDLARFPVDFAYTIDACGVGEFVFETFNAAQATVEIHGVTAHPMSAIGVMVNPVLVATDFIARFDPLDTPEHTEGRNGYCYVTGITANSATATIAMSLRDFDESGLAARKQMVQAAVAATQAAHPRATITCRIEDSYRNIGASLGNDRRCLDLLERGFADLGIKPKIFPMRGGTDGSALSARGIPTPNYFTGGLNFHSRFECLPVSSFVLAYQLTVRLCTLAAG
ncbi:peptidase T [Acidisphaera sp. L21]|uniref:peptidase T n=1 Tax=Acidisphaera sp. L21 TaxID=1641851 RepID=UPI00131E4041|nr:peptidase T [Acidisphaera sp. L21]